ncbi:hypothetical protein [Mycolicibacterium sp. lyk4-40-TYG-92]|uniref:hypothetical protein n=1 Tax=Mycolicibacterium sp. lyk4-40-TYG-92 TaxID=3040295 RepID=UPI0025514859|nr:hypothetical protein [Mycolicibacterium sp. lyk4-40-TYG-92]
MRVGQRRAGHFRADPSAGTKAETYVRRWSNGRGRRRLRTSGFVGICIDTV